MKWNENRLKKKLLIVGQTFLRHELSNSHRVCCYMLYPEDVALTTNDFDTFVTRITQICSGTQTKRVNVTYNKHGWIIEMLSNNNSNLVIKIPKNYPKINALVNIRRCDITVSIYEVNRHGFERQIYCIR